MLRYELLMLASPEITKDEETNLEKHIDKFIGEAKGSILTFDRWGKYRLAYPVKGNSYGVYFLVRFDVKEMEVLQELRRMFYVKFNDIVMRHMVSRLDKDASLEYKRPPSLEDTPKRHIGFLAESELKHGSTLLKDDKALRQAQDDREGVVEEEVSAKEDEKIELADKKEQTAEIAAPGKDDQKNEEANKQEV